MTFYVYKRVSTDEQDLQRQTNAIDAHLKASGIKKREVKTFEDKATGTNTNRDGFQKMMKKIDAGDVIIVSELDRLGRNLKQIRQTIQDIRNKGASLQILNLPQMDAGDSRLNAVMNDFILDLMAYIAELEHERILKRTAQGREVARKEGRLIGRPKALSPEGTKKNEYHRILQLYNDGKNPTEISRLVGVGRTSVYRVLETLKTS